MAMQIFVVMKQFENEAPKVSCAYVNRETAQKHVDDIVSVCQGEPMYKYYVQESVVIKL
jgi:hypothetical protein